MKEDKKYNKVCEQIDKKIDEITKVGVQQTNVDYLYKLIDIKKDIKEMEDGEMIYRNDYDNYGNYGNYGNYDNYGARRRDNQGRFMGSGNYGRRYRGHDYIDEMSEHYGNYMENRENGRYGNAETSKSLEYMLRATEDLYMYLMEDAKTEEERNMIKQTFRKLANK